MKTTIRFVFLLIASVIITSCNSQFHSNTKRIKPITQQHEIIAILPPIVQYMDVKDVKERRARENYTKKQFQIAIQNHLVRLRSKGKMNARILSLATTNERLKEAGWFNDTFVDPKAVCELLAVDGYISSEVIVQRPFPVGVAIANEILTNSNATPINQSMVRLNVVDGKSEMHLWYYEQAMNGGLWSNPQVMTERIVRNALAKIPYKQ